ncbi:leucine rich repeat serine:threonine protein [Trichuris trichiura]|uniref:non-specific serine/threonine protein kinase n=1 Tax=Trichuris trichiura TaxID=36087 RepID=A0A077ZFQ7_TRITR|nr:leucine rich repeat serine:threonine protein [Trichuris trichiura]
MAELLVRYGAGGEINPVTFNSPLYIATHAGHTSTVKLLLMLFPELAQVATAEKWLPLHAAAKIGNLEIVKLLFEHPFPKYVLNTYFDDSGAFSYNMAFNVNAIDAEGMTPLMIAVDEGHLLVVDYLLQVVVMVRPVTVREVDDVADASPSLFECKPFHPVRSNLRDAKGFTALHMAVMRRRSDLIRLLLDHGADINLPLTKAVSSMFQFPFEDCSGTSGALLLACHLNDVQLVEALLKREAVDPDNKALSLSFSNKFSDIVTKLLSHLVFVDPEYSVNKRAMNLESIFLMGGGRSVVPSALYPSTSVIVNWHNAYMPAVQESWLVEAARYLNPCWKLSSMFVSHVITSAITRIDLSMNKLTYLPSSLFRLSSLRILNASSNCITSIMVEDTRRTDNVGDVGLACCLEEIYLDHNSLSSVPDILFTFPAVVTLNLSSNMLESLPANIWDCPKLKDLDLSDNKLSFFPLPDRNSELRRSNQFCPYYYSSSNDGASFTDTEGERCHSNEDTVASSDVDSLSAWHTDSSVVVHDLNRHNLWQNIPDLLQLSDNGVSAQGTKGQLYHLNSLNLSRNRFESVPQMLSCLAPGLSRLNMSYNLLREIGPVNTYPAGLKHLDLSGNKIRRWFTAVLHPTSTALFTPHAGRSPSRSSYSPLSSRRSHSVSRLSRLNVGSVEHGDHFAINVCKHRSNRSRLENLRTLLLADNCLEGIVITLEDLTHVSPVGTTPVGRRRSSSTQRPKLKVAEAELSNPDVDFTELRQSVVFPNLSMLDVSHNFIDAIPPSIAALQCLATLNLSNNPKLSTLPAEMGLLSRLWNLNLTGLNLAEPLNDLFDSKKCKTIDIIGYLKSILEEYSKPYARLKLMIVGVQGIGKTSLLEQLRAEGTVPKRRSSEGWARRMGSKSVSQKTATGRNISTVGVDVNEWTYQPRRQKGRVRVPITFRTWDFGGQREYYATHQYFLSKRSIYLVVWRLTDGDSGIAEFAQWLINIQARAPNSPVIIVGTHLDAVNSNRKIFPPLYVETMQKVIRERFINISDADKRGLPRVIESLAVSSVTRENMRTLCDVIYKAATELRSPGSKVALIEQQVPSAYIALEEIVVKLAAERKAAGREPVMNAEVFRTTVQAQMQKHFGRSFRDSRELNQAVVFLHENGVMLHYDDVTLKDLYFLDPQWLCDILAHVITIREINPFAKGGVMRMDDLKILFKATKLSASSLRSYALNLLQKFEVALTWDNQTLLIPSLLPDEYQLRAGYPGCDVKVPVNPKYSAPARKPRYRSLTTKHSTVDGSKRPAAVQRLPLVAPRPTATPNPSFPYSSVYFQHDSSTIRRLYIMVYFPSGFWSRFITRMLGDDKVHDIFESYFDVECTAGDPSSVGSVFDSNLLNWSLWQTGMEVNFLGATLASFKEFLPMALVREIDYRNLSLKYRHEGSWCSLDTNQSSILEIHQPHLSYDVTVEGSSGKSRHTLCTNRRAMTRLLAATVEILDTLLEDWYPSLGTRFIHTSEGRYLITRLVPCPQCTVEASKLVISAQKSEDSWTLLTLASNMCVNVESDNALDHPFPAVQIKKKTEGTDAACLYCFTIEECILAASDTSAVLCPEHGVLPLNAIAPDSVFADLDDNQLIVPTSVKRGKLLGRGAFGFVFKAVVHLQPKLDLSESHEVALKMLQPVDPGFGAQASALAMFKAALVRWKRDPVQNSCRAYCTARQELNVLLKLKHPNIVPLIGVCPFPLSLAFCLAPLGSLRALLKNYKRSGASLNWTVIQETASQIAKALEYLHQRHVIYRDLKSENVLVWRFPPPFNQLTNVEVKLGDYGISRSALPMGNMKGFGGTEGFMAPEIIRYNGEEEYTERVDCYSFGMFLYEMYTLKMPFEGHEQVKEFILDGGRPAINVKDTLYPSNFLDIMVKCWSQRSSDRPSSSQLVSLTTAPEFSHLLDVVSLEDPDAAVAAGDAFLLEDYSTEDNSVMETELWVSRADGRISILSSDSHGWFEYKSVSVNEDSIITAMCLVGDRVWLSELTGMVRIYCAKTYSELFNFSIAPFALAKDECASGFHLHVERMFGLDKWSQVVLTLCEPGTVLLCHTDSSSEREPVAKAVRCPSGDILCSTLFPFSERQAYGQVYRLWTCSTGGNIVTFDVANGDASYQESFPHAQESVSEVGTALLTSSMVADLYVWKRCVPMGYEEKGDKGTLRLFQNHSLF